MTAPDVPPGGPAVAPEPPRIPVGIAWELPAPAPDAADQLVDGVVDELRGVTFYGGAFTPLPVVAIDGSDIAAGPGPGGVVEGQIVVDGLWVRWGRSAVLEQPDPATGQLQLFDSTKTWATDRDVDGLPVTLRWEGLADGVPSSGVFLRGRIGKVTVKRHTVTNPDGSRLRGSLVTMPLRSLVADGGNRVPTASWPAETLEARRARLAALVTSIATTVTVRDYWKVPNVEPVAAVDQVSLLDHLVALYDSCGADRLTYLPNDQSLSFIPRRDYYTVRGLAGLFWNQAGQANNRAEKGAYIRSYALTPTGGATGLPNYLDAAALETDQDTISRVARVTRVLLDHPDEAAAYATRNVELTVPGVNEAVVGERTAQLSSQVAWNAYADVAASDFVSFVQKEGAAWQLPALTWRTRKSGGWEAARQGQTLLAGGETTTVMFLQRSWLPEYGIRPIFGVMGGVIGYRDGGWEIELELAPVVTTLWQHAITWEEIDDGSTAYEVQWHDDDHPQGMHETLTYDDLAYCSTGMGVVTIPADQGWDRHIK